MTDRPTAWSMEGTGGSSGFPPGGSPPPQPPFGSPPPPPPGTVPPPPQGPRRDGPAWERRRAILDLGALFATVRDVLIDAPRTFAGMVREGGLGGPLVFLLLLGTLFGWIGMFWEFLWNQALGATAFGTGALDLSQFGIDQDAATLAFVNSSLFQAVMALALPAMILLVFFIEAAIFHLMLLIVGGANQPFETTARVVAYTSGATAVFQAVPICGGVITFVWGVIVVIIGLAYAHETSVGRAVAAVLLPLLLCCLCCVLAVILLGVSFAQLTGANL